MSEKDNYDIIDKKTKKIVRTMIALSVLISGFFILNPLVIVGAGERGVVMRFGAVQDRIMDEGIHFRTPLMESVEKLSVKTQKYETDVSAASKDLQIVPSVIAVNYRLNPESVNWLYQNIGMGYKQLIIEPAIQEAVKASTSKYTAEELITQRPLARETMVQLFKEKMVDLSSGSIIVEDVNIVNFDFSSEFNLAIEKKVTAEQKALEEQWNLERVKFEAQQSIEKAKAEAQALTLQGESVRESPELIELRRVEVEKLRLDVQKAAIEKWDGKLPIWITSGGEMPFISIDAPGG